MQALVDLYNVTDVGAGVKQPIIEDQPIYRAFDEAGSAIAAWNHVPSERRSPEYLQAYLKYVGSVIKAPEKSGADDFFSIVEDEFYEFGSRSQFFPTDESRAGFLVLIEPILTDDNFPDEHIAEYYWVKNEARRILATEQAQVLKRQLKQNDGSQRGMLLAYMDLHNIENKEQLLAAISGIEGEFYASDICEKIIAVSQDFLEETSDEPLYESAEMVAFFDEQMSSTEAKQQIDVMLAQMNRFPV